MTTGDEPMLPQPADDNAPMISGRGTKIIADARGVYLAGNETALISYLNPDQQMQFRQILVREALHQLRLRQPYEFLRDTLALQERVCAVVEQWCQNPTSETGEVLTSILLDEHAATLVHRPREDAHLELIGLHPNLSGALALAIVETDLSRVTTYVFGILWLSPGEGRKPNDPLAIEAARRWPIEVAWAILSNRSLPSWEDMFSPENPT